MKLQDLIQIEDFGKGIENIYTKQIIKIKSTSVAKIVLKMVKSEKKCQC